MFTRKPSKREQCKKEKVIWYNTSTYPEQYWSSNTYYRVVSIDPGIVNFCIRIEDRYKDGRILTVFTEKKQYKLDQGDIMLIYQDLLSYLGTLLEYTWTAHYCIIERQMAVNYQSTRISQHIITYFLMLYSQSPVMPIVLEIDSKAKYSMLDAPGILNDKALKKWGQDKAKELLAQRGEHELIEYINGTRGVRGQKKQDDLCDVIIQAEAFFIMYPII